MSFINGLFDIQPLAVTKFLSKITFIYITANNIICSCTFARRPLSYFIIYLSFVLLPFNRLTKLMVKIACDSEPTKRKAKPNPLPFVFICLLCLIKQQLIQTPSVKNKYTYISMHIPTRITLYNTI